MQITGTMAVEIEAGRAQFRAELEQFQTAKAEGFDAFQQKASEAFRLVEPVGNWKGAIDAVVYTTPARLGFVLEAVVFFTGSVPTIEHVGGGFSGPRRFRVKAAGYYAAVGA